MPIRLRCPECNAQLSIATRKAGQTIVCPGCQTSILVPQPEGAGVAGPSSPAGIPPRPPHEPEDDEPSDDEGLQLRRPETEFEEMDLTPMVDVTFLLLIFFMITASFSIQKTLPIPRPEPDKEGAAQTLQLKDVEQDSIVVVTDEHNGITVDDRPVDRGTLLPEIERQMREQDKHELLLKSHYYTSHEITVLVLDAAAEAGMQKVRVGILPGTGPK